MYWTIKLLKIKKKENDFIKLLLLNIIPIWFCNLNTLNTLVTSTYHPLPHTAHLKFVFKMKWKKLHLIWMSERNWANSPNIPIIEKIVWLQCLEIGFLCKQIFFVEKMRSEKNNKEKVCGMNSSGTSFTTLDVNWYRFLTQN